MKIFITGSTGFISRHIIRLLVQEGHEPALLVRTEESGFDEIPNKGRIKFIVGDVVI
jgi:nucleoside-diphosphate-sugar epimerase